MNQIRVRRKRDSWETLVPFGPAYVHESDRGGGRERGRVRFEISLPPLASDGRVGVRAVTGKQFPAGVFSCLKADSPEMFDEFEPVQS